MVAVRVAVILSLLLAASASSKSLNATQKKCSSYPHDHHMACGEGVRLCGVLTLETGDGSGFYHHKEPGVHGLWPQTGRYGNSECVKPKVGTDPQKIYDCYKSQDGSVSTSHQLAFEKHEWEKHGSCAGVTGAESFFSQVCSLAAGPLKVMTAAKAAGMDISAVGDQLQRSGYCVYQTMTQFQIELSACAGQDGQWKLADIEDFPSVCKWDGPAPPSPSPSPAACSPGTRGPSCTKDTDCTGLSGCKRCASTGYCTDEPKPHLIV